MKRFAGGPAPTGALAEALVAAVTDTFLLADSMGRILFLAADVEEVLGRTLENWIGTSALDLVHPDDLPAVVSRLTNALSSTNSQQQCIHISMGKGGQWFPVELHGFNPIPYDGVTAVLVAVRETTGRLLIDEAQRFSERSLTPSAPVPDAADTDQRIAKALQHFRTDRQALLMHVRLVNHEEICAEGGVSVANEMLIDTAARIVSRSRGNDMVARIDDDALLIVCVDVEAKDANHLAERVFHLCKEGDRYTSGCIEPVFELGFALASDGDDLAEVRAYAAAAAQFN